MSIEYVSEQLGLTPQFLLGVAEIASTQYEIFDLPKRSGGTRTICSPKPKLKAIQRLILDEILSKHKMPPYVHGCVKGRSVVTNASGHVNKPLVINIDLRNFFGTIRQTVVKDIFVNYFQFNEECADIFAAITTYGNFLPQGAPTSPTLANLAALKLDAELIKIGTESGDNQYHYSRYVDDITISGGTKLSFLLADMYRAIERNGFSANPQKLKVSRPSSRQKVTGVVVNQKLAPPKKLIRKVRQQLYYCRKYSVREHCENQNVLPEDFLNQITGLLGYISMTQPDTATVFAVELRKLQREFCFGHADEDFRKIETLNYAIGNEKIVKFTYERSQIKVAPTEVWLDDDGLKAMKGFQITPESGWNSYFVRNIENLEIIDVRP